MTIAISVGILGVFLIIFFNLNGFFASWNQHVQLIVYLDDDISSSQKNKLENLFKANARVESTEEVTKERAWQEFSLNADTELGFNPLPASYRVRFKVSENRSSYIREFAERARSAPGVESVEYGEKWIDRFEKFMVFCRVFLMGTGALLSFGLTLIISNTIRLN